MHSTAKSNIYLKEKKSRRGVDSSKGKDAARDWILEVGLEYPKELHEEYNRYPLATEKTSVREECISSYQKELSKKEKLSFKDEKVVLSLQEKKNCVLHYGNPQEYLSLGTKLKKVHKVLHRSSGR